jgi:hypothetical protein
MVSIPVPISATGAQQLDFTTPTVYERHDLFVGEEAAMWCADPMNPRHLARVMLSFGSTPVALQYQSMSRLP